MKTINVIENIEGNPVVWAFSKTKRGRKDAETLFLSLAKENDVIVPLHHKWKLSDGYGYKLAIVESEKIRKKTKKDG